MKTLNICFKRWLIPVLILILHQLLFASSEIKILKFDKEKMHIGKSGEYDWIDYGNTIHSLQEGAPQLPVEVIRLPLQPGQKIVSVKVINVIQEEIKGSYKINPVQPPQVLSNKTAKRISPNSKIYSSNTIFPAIPVQASHSGYLSGYNIGAILVYPIQYIPAKKQLLFNSQIEVEITYSESPANRLAIKPGKTLNSKKYVVPKNLLNASVNNLSSSIEAGKPATKLPDETHKYVIITTNRMLSSFQPLADWKRKKGYSATVVTTTWIEGEYSGADLQEQIRNFIIDASVNWGTEWILLGSDTDGIPDRKAFAMDCEYGDYEDNYIPCDLYYADLDGNWNANGNNIYGETDDGVDLYPDVFIGRASVEDETEAQAFVNKVLVYEKYEGMDNALDMLFLAGILWNNPFTDSGDMKNYIDIEFVPERFDPITKLYTSLDNDDMTSVLNAINSGNNIINHCNHAWHNGVSTGGGLLGLDEADGFTNGPNTGIFYTIGCWPGAIDYDCFGEHFIANPNGGGVAFIGNSRYGWGSPGNPVYGYSDRFDQKFFELLFQEDIYHIGQTLAAAKAHFIPFSSQENVYRWHQYEVNLLGDPEMPIWTDTPEQLGVEYPPELPSGGSNAVITVKTEGIPVEGAMVCLMQGENVYEVGVSNASGQVSLSYNFASPAELMHLTVTAKNCIPFEETITVNADGPYVAIQSFSTNGNKNGYIKPGDTVLMDVCFKNYGSVTATAVSANLSNVNPDITLTDAAESIPDIAAGDSIVITGAFAFETDMHVQNEEAFFLTCNISENGNDFRPSSIALTGITPVLEYVSHTVNDAYDGNGNGITEPGETVHLSIKIMNTGLDTLLSSAINYSYSEELLTLNSPINFVDQMVPGEFVFLTHDVTINGSCPEISFIPVTINFIPSADLSFSDSLTLTVGEVVFTDSMETVPSNWNHAGETDLWHISTARKHSGNHSWACNKIGEYEFENNMADNTLTSDPVTIGKNASLSFWAWYECPNYGTTGFYAEVSDNGSDWETLDFIGSGGALEWLPTGMDWYEYSYNLSDYPAGETVQVRFRFQSDDETVTEGVYIDDVIIRDAQHNIHISAPPIPPTPDVILSEGETNINISWEESLNLDEIESFDQENYTFQGYNVYQLQSLHPFRQNGSLIATFDIADGITDISEKIIDPLTGISQDTVLYPGTDSGLEYNFTFTKDYLDDLYFIQGKTYYFAVTGYAHNNDPVALPHCTESVLAVIVHTFKEDAPGPLYGDTLVINHSAGVSDGNVVPIIRDPNIFTGHNYRVEFSQPVGESVFWDLFDITAQSTILTQQPLYNDSVDVPITDGFQLYVMDVDLLDFSTYVVNGTGNYDISSHYRWNWSPSARATDTYNGGDGTGTNDLNELSNDYEFRFSGEYMNPGADVVYIEEGTGSMATIVGARQYDLADHPMNPNPGSNEPFTVRIPFEVWNVDDEQQVNMVIYDRLQRTTNTPFYAFYPNGRTYCWILNTPYHETPLNWEENEQDHLTWSLDFWNTQFVTGDVISVFYDNPFTIDDIFTFYTEANGIGEDDIDFKYDLLQNYPNPFNPSTTIRFRLKKAQPVTIKIYNILGDLVRTLKTNGSQLYVVWDGKDQTGKNAASGIYFYQMQAGDFTKARKMLLLR